MRQSDGGRTWDWNGGRNKILLRQVKSAPNNCRDSEATLISESVTTISTFDLHLYNVNSEVILNRRYTGCF